MKAVAYSSFGAPDVLEVKNVEKPVPNDGEVLIEVRAASVNPLDGSLVKGMPHMVRLLHKCLRSNLDAELICATDSSLARARIRFRLPTMRETNLSSQEGLV